MVTLNQTTKLPWSVRFYGLTWLFILLLIITFIGSIGGNGGGAFNLFGRFMIFVALWLLLHYACISYVVKENTITINSGVLIKKSKSIPFANVQDVNTSRGIISMMFGVSKINIWTASPGQIQINNGNSTNKPTGSLTLNKEDATWLQQHILNGKSL